MIQKPRHTQWKNNLFSQPKMNFYSQLLSPYTALHITFENRREYTCSACRERAGVLGVWRAIRKKTKPRRGALYKFWIEYTLLSSKEEEERKKEKSWLTNWNLKLLTKLSASCMLTIHISGYWQKIWKYL